MFWADTVGGKYIANRLRNWSELYGDFFKPCPYLEDRAARGVKLVGVCQLFATRKAKWEGFGRSCRA